MKFAQAREIVKKHPKRIGNFVRGKLPNGAVSRATVINYVRYNLESPDIQHWQFGYSTGNGHVYGYKILSGVAMPNLNVKHI